MPRLNYAKLTILIILLAGLLRFVLASLTHISGDACWHFSVSRFMATTGQIPLFEVFGGGNRDVFWAPPLFHFVAAAVYKITSFSPALAEFSVRMISPLFGTLTLVFVYLIGKKLFDQKIAFFATLFMALLPIHLYYSALAFVDVFMAFFIVLSMYLLLQKRLILAGIVFGLALLAKQNALIFFPFLLYILYSDYTKKILLKKAVLFSLTTGIIGSFWFVRNFVVFGNPFWPFLYKIFGGNIAPTAAETIFNPFNVLDPGLLVQGYLATFGVPLGNLALLIDYALPFKPVTLSLWAAATIVFFFPILLGISRLYQHKKAFHIFIVLIVTSLAGLAIYIMNLDQAYMRLILPVYLALAFPWALGFNRLLQHKIFPLVLVGLVGISFVFVGAERGKSPGESESEIHR